MFTNATVTIPGQDGKEGNPSVCKGTVLTNATIKPLCFLRKSFPIPKELD